MEPRFSLRNVLLSVLRCKLMKDEETRAWEELIDLFDEKHLAQLWDMFAVENTELSGALKSLDDYLQYFHACEERRQTWLHTIEHEDAGLTFAVTAVLQSKRHWTGPQIDEAFKTDASVCTFLAGLSIRDLEQMRKVIDLHDQAGEYDDEDGKPTKARNTLIGIVTFLQEDAWNAEQKEAEELQPILQNISSAHEAQRVRQRAQGKVSGQRAALVRAPAQVVYDDLGAGQRRAGGGGAYGERQCDSGGSWRRHESCAGPGTVDETGGARPAIVGFKIWRRFFALFCRC